MAIRDELPDLTVKAASPSEKVFASLRGTSELSVSFAPGYYGRATTDDMQVQLSRVARLLFVERTRMLYDGLSAEAGTRVEPGQDRLHRDARRYREGLDELSAEGSSAEGEVTVFGVGLSNFTVQVAPGVLNRLDEASFAAACARAAEDFLATYERAIRQLKYDVYYREDAERLGLGSGV